MADENNIQRLHLAEDEDVEKARQWWKKYGVGIVAGVAIGISGVVGINGWRMYVDHRGENASALYESMIDGVRGRNGKARQLAETLLDDYADTPYVDGAALMLAKLELEAGNYAQARSRLEWVLENSKEPSFRHAARLRLASIALDQGDLQHAQSLLVRESAGSFQAMYDELRGDVLVQRGDIKAAQAAYDMALVVLARQRGVSDLLQVKRDRITRK
jgi:predicted negative regulator of RcsB-dependent stress response